jgi:hypothetical protein
MAPRKRNSSSTGDIITPLKKASVNEVDNNGWCRKNFTVNANNPSINPAPIPKMRLRFKFPEGNSTTFDLEILIR